MSNEELYKILENNLDTISCREVIDYIEKLQEEKEKYKRYVDNDFLYTYEELQDKVIKKQQRIDKAIYFIDTEEKIYEIKNTIGYSNVIDYIIDINDFKNKLTKILKGESDEEN